MNEDLIRQYQETISLLHYRKPNYSYHGEFVSDELGKTAFKLIYYKRDEGLPWVDANEIKTKIFKYTDNSENALRYFIKTAQNRVF